VCGLNVYIWAGIASLVFLLQPKNGGRLSSRADESHPKHGDEGDYFWAAFIRSCLVCPRGRPRNSLQRLVYNCYSSVNFPRHDDGPPSLAEGRGYA